MVFCDFFWFVDGCGKTRVFCGICPLLSAGNYLMPPVLHKNLTHERPPKWDPKMNIYIYTYRWIDHRIIKDPLLHRVSEPVFTSTQRNYIMISYSSLAYPRLYDMCFESFQWFHVFSVTWNFAWRRIKPDPALFGVKLPARKQRTWIWKLQYQCQCRSSKHHLVVIWQEGLT